jgi:hypothetical protein
VSGFHGRGWDDRSGKVLHSRKCRRVHLPDDAAPRQGGSLLLCEQATQPEATCQDAPTRWKSCSLKIVRIRCIAKQTGADDTCVDRRQRSPGVVGRGRETDGILPFTTCNGERARLRRRPILTFRLQQSCKTLYPVHHDAPVVGSACAAIPATVQCGHMGRQDHVCRYLIAPTTLFANSAGLPACHRHTTIKSCSGDTTMLLLPAPNAAYAVAGMPGRFLPLVFSHHRYP